jgi:hypothetical protein
MTRVVVFLLLGAFLAVAYLALAAGADAGRGLPPYSVFSGERDGLAAAARVLRGLRFEPVALTRPIQHTRHHGLVILIEPFEEDVLGRTRPGLTGQDSQALLDWVAAGNTLVLMTRYRTPIHYALHVHLNNAPKPNEEPERTPGIAETEEVGGYTEPGTAAATVPVNQLAIEGRQTLTASGGLPLWTIGNRPGAVVMPHGKGRVLLSADSTLWTHRQLGRTDADNVLLLYNVAALDSAGGRVYFDEYHHGLRSSGGYWDYLRYHELHWNVLQLLAVAAVAVWGVGVRLGPAVPLPRPPRNDAVDYASAVARIYQRAGVRHLVAGNLVRDFLETLTGHLRLRRHTPPAQVLAAWQQRHGKESAERLAALLRGVAALQKVASGEDMTERELLYWSRAFDHFREENRLTVKA